MINHSTQTAEPTKVKLLRGYGFAHAVASIGAFLAPVIGLTMLMSNEKGREK